jgi:hypothetical protein
MRHLIASFMLGSCLVVGFVHAQSCPPKGTTTAPFTECPPVGADTSCGVLIYYNCDGTVGVGTDLSQPPYEHIDDTLVGVQNNSPNPIYYITVQGSFVFSFDGDGVCGTDPNTGGPINPRPAGCPFGPTGYEGPGVTFTNNNSSGGTIVFGPPQYPNGLPPGQSAWFTLEGSNISVHLCGSAPDTTTNFVATLPLGDVCSDLNSSTWGTRNVQWGSFGTSQSLLFTSGEKLELKCDTYPPGGTTGHTYILYYTKPGVGTHPVGINAWPNGCNSVLAKAAYTGPPNAPTASCLVNTNFLSKDYNSKTYPNAFTAITNGADQNAIDWFTSYADATIGGLSKTLQLYQPISPYPTCVSTDTTQLVTSIQARYVIDPQIGPQTDAFFQNVVTSLSTEPPGTSHPSSFSPADFNHDGKVDQLDFAIFQKALGSCAGKANYNGATDLDSDGCVTFKDYQIWYQLYTTH